MNYSRNRIIGIVLVIVAILMISAGGYWYWENRSYQVLSPKSGDQWEIGTSQIIKWQADSSIDQVNIYLQSVDGRKIQIATYISNSGSYSWTPTNEIAPGQYSISILPYSLPGWHGIPYSPTTMTTNFKPTSGIFSLTSSTNSNEVISLSETNLVSVNTSPVPSGLSPFKSTDLGPAAGNLIEESEIMLKEGISYEDINIIESWFSKYGLIVKSVVDSPSGKSITFSGTVQQIDSLFNTQIHAYKFANMSCQGSFTAVKVSAQIASLVKEPIPLNNCVELMPVVY